MYFGFRYVSRTEITDKDVPDLTKLTRSVPKSGVTTHGYCLGTQNVPRVWPSYFVSVPSSYPYLERLILERESNQSHNFSKRL